MSNWYRGYCIPFYRARMERITDIHLKITYQSCIINIIPLDGLTTQEEGMVFDWLCPGPVASEASLIIGLGNGLSPVQHQVITGIDDKLYSAWRLATQFNEIWSKPLYSARSIKWIHDDVTKWNHFPRYWPFVRRIHRSPVNSPHKGQWRGALIFSLICVWINGWVNNRKAGDLRHYRAHYDVIVMFEMFVDQ